MWIKASNGNVPSGAFGYFPPKTYNSIHFCQVYDETKVRKPLKIAYHTYARSTIQGRVTQQRVHFIWRTLYALI